MTRRRQAPIVAAGLLLAAGPAGAEPESFEDRWFDKDIEALTAAVNEGELEFLAEPPEKAVHHLVNRLEVRPGSLDDGWLGLHQCHRNLDAVPATQIVYRYDGIRDLRVDSHAHIGRVWVEGQSVQLEDVERGGSVCVRADVQILEHEDGAWVVRNGPFHRRFLDGYYPMHVTLEISHPDSLVVDAVSPAEQPGLAVERRSERLTLDAWFEGRLRTEVRFSD